MTPFSERSKPWELEAAVLRRLAGVTLGGRLDPWRLAPILGLRVVALETAVRDLTRDERLHLVRTAERNWSGGVYPRKLPDGSRICILNSKHSPRRQKITLMEEISHIHLKHAPSGLAIAADGVQVREYVKDHEEEAYGVGAATLIPWQSLFPALNRGVVIDELAEAYDVTPELVTYRIKITGAYRLYEARQRRRA